jgi:hypothetical protein
VSAAAEAPSIRWEWEEWAGTQIGASPTIAYTAWCVVSLKVASRRMVRSLALSAFLAKLVKLGTRWRRCVTTILFHGIAWSIRKARLVSGRNPDSKNVNISCWREKGSYST